MSHIELKVVARSVYVENPRVVVKPSFYGIEAIPDEGERIVNSTLYPFTTSLVAREALEDFIVTYEEALKNYYLGKGDYGSNSFLVSHFGFDTALKERVQDRWYKRGVIIN